MLTFFLILIFLSKGIWMKYLEGELKTNDNWAFLARFCFLSGDGQFEFYIEYNDEQGQPNLLLYYDTLDQWPAVYKTSKTCIEKESALKIEQNQIINLTINSDNYRELSGCSIIPLSSPLKPSTTKNPSTIKFVKSKKNNTMTRFQKTIESGNTKAIKLSTIYTTTETTEFSTETTWLPSVTTEAENDSLNYNLFNNYNIEMAPLNFSEDNLNENVTEGLDLTSESTIKSTEEYKKTTKIPIQKRAVATKSSPSQRKRNSSENKAIACHNARKFRSSRERWWFIAVSNCLGTKGIHIKYRILMTNGLPGDYWHEQFSADEFYILPILMAFSIAYSFLILGIVVCSIELKSRQLLHSTYKLFVISVSIQFFGIILESMAYLKYAVNGVGSPNIKMFGEIFMGCSETCFLLLLLLLAKGYTITRGRLSLTASVKLTIFMCLYSITYITLFIYEAKVFDPGEVLYLYESPAGYGLIILRIFAWCTFIYSTVFTLKKYPEKSNFYYPFNICGTLWFIAGPAFILSANTYIDKWIRESVVCAVLLFITFGGHLTFLLLTMPSVANKNFPYHVRTTQIGVTDLRGNLGGNTIEHFSHHVYEPTANVEQTVIIPLTRRTEELFGGIYNQHLYNNNSLGNATREDLNTPPQTSLDIVMENVLTWSLAKNLSALEFGCSENFQHTAISDSPDFRRNNSITGRNSIQSPQRSCDEWVKEVPIELFTVSKLVINKNENTEHKEE